MVGFEVLIGGLPFRNQFFKSPKFLNWLHPRRESYPMLVNWCVIVVYRAVLLLYGHLLAASDHHLPALFLKEGAR